MFIATHTATVQTVVSPSAYPLAFLGALAFETILLSCRLRVDALLKPSTMA